MSDALAKTIRIYPDGSVRKLHDAADVALYGTTSRRRASRVEPTFWLLRWIFRLTRLCVSDESRVAAWTRRWPCSWRARLFDGSILGPHPDRNGSIAAEQQWLIENWVLQDL